MMPPEHRNKHKIILFIVVLATPACTGAYNSNRTLIYNKKLSYRRETARQLRTSFSARLLIVLFTEHRICYRLLKSYRHYQPTNCAT